MHLGTLSHRHIFNLSIYKCLLDVSEHLNIANLTSTMLRF